MWAALFPGQGSQSVGMGKFLYENFPVAKLAFEEASDTLAINFKQLCFDGPEKDLQLTENTQPALLLVSTATFRVVAETTGFAPRVAAGHSVGEYAAVVTAGALSFAHALQAVRRRGEEMQKAVPVGEGGMVAVMGLSDAQAVRLCNWAEEASGAKPLEPANFNSPGQVVISGSQKVIDWLKAHASTEIFAPDTPRMKLIPLSVSAPFHCSLMQPAEEAMTQVLAKMEFKKAAWPIVQNISAEETEDPKSLRNNLVRQISGSVRWTQCMQRMKAMGARNFVELGAGKVLTGLAKKIDSEGPTPFNINTLDDIKKLETALKGHS